MTEKILLANTYIPSAHTTGTPQVVVGTWPVLSDESDATYIDHDLDNGRLDYFLQFDPLEAFESGDPITLKLRVSATGGGTSWMFTFLQTSTTPNTEIAQFTPGAWNSVWSFGPSDGVVREVTGSLVVRPGYTLQQSIDALANGAYLLVNSFHSSDWETYPPMGRLIEAAIHVGLPDPPILTIAGQQEGTRIRFL